MLLSGRHFCAILVDTGFQSDPVESIFADFAVFVQKGIEIEARKECMLGFQLEETAEQGGACLIMQIAKVCPMVYSRLAPPCRGAANMECALCRRPLAIAHCFKSLDSLHFYKRLLVFVVPKLMTWHA